MKEPEQLLHLLVGWLGVGELALEEVHVLVDHSNLAGLAGQLDQVEVDMETHLRRVTQ